MNSMPEARGMAGLIPPLVAPMHDDGSLDWESLRRHASGLVRAGSDGLWVNGTSGEFHALTREERARVIGEVRDAVPRGTALLVAQVGAPSTREAVALATDAAAAGADSIAAITPYYLALPDDDIADYYRALHAAVDLPLVVYQVPMMAKTMLTVDTVLQLAREGTIAGIKDSSGDIVWLRHLLVRAAAEGVGIRAFIGGGTMVDVSLLAGAAGAMCAVANVAPTHVAGLLAAARSGDWTAASAMQDRLVQLARAMELPSRPGWAATLSVLKFILAERGIIAGAACAGPLRPLGGDERERLRQLAIPIVEELEGAPKVLAAGGGSVHADH